ncbi:MAG: hypothetical protein ABI382_10410 [Nakamurella sp.]
MAILIVLVILWTPYLMLTLVRATNPRTPTAAHPQWSSEEVPNRALAGTGSPNGSAWTALDERQLTRLLTDAARRTNTE